jgi:lactoylglutathione lyase
MIRVKNLDESTRFYTERLGMKVLRRIDSGEGKLIAFVGYGGEEEHAVLELSFSSDKLDYVRGEFFGHIAIGVPNVRSTFETLCRTGVKPLRKPRVKDGEVIASIEDPNGYKIELIEVES